VERATANRGRVARGLLEFRAYWYCSNFLAKLLDGVYSIVYVEEAEQDLQSLRKYDSRRIVDEVDAQLTLEPTTPSARRKLLEGLVPPWDAVPPIWQLRVDDFRVFYDVDEERQEVIVRAVRHKGTKRTEEIL
jgi:mRNA-degrading endonuclease RelE of RelBE toxin-antitoxin system